MRYTQIVGRDRPTHCRPTYRDGEARAEEEKMKNTTEKNEIPTENIPRDFFMGYGDLIVRVGETRTVDCDRVTDDVWVRPGGKLTADALSRVGGNVLVEKVGKLTADALSRVDVDVRVGSGATLTAGALTTVRGNVWVEPGGTLTAGALTTVRGNVWVEPGGTLNAPKLRRKK